MIDLLDCVSMASSRRVLAIELPLNPDLLPCLVSSATRDCYIVVRKSRNRNSVVAGVRDGQPNKEALYASLIDTCLRASKEYAWGSVCDSLQSAKAYLKEQGLDDLEVLYQEGLQDIEGTPVSWLPFQGAVVVPKDRSFLGTLVLLCNGSQYASLVHNPARGIAFYLNP